MELLDDTIDNDGDGHIKVQMGNYIYTIGELDGDCGWIIRTHIDAPEGSLEEEPIAWGPFGEIPKPKFKFLSNERVR